MKKPILDIKNLSIVKKSSPLISGASLKIHKGEIVGLFGESGSGKSVFSLFLLGLLNRSVFNVSGDVASFFDNGEGFSFFSNNPESWNLFRATKVSLIFQDPGVSLNPTLTCGWQLEEALFFSLKKNRKERCFSLFFEVGLESPEKIYNSFPHELSGGEKQRVVVAIALAPNPSLLIADEPTTSLDPSTQKGVLDLILKIKKSRDLGVLLISHDLDLVNYFCEKTYVFENQRFYLSDSVFGKKQLSKKLAVLKKIKNRVLKKRKRRAGVVFKLKNISVSFSRSFFALRDVSFSVFDSEILGVVGGSGSGKTTLGRVLCGIQKVSSGEFSFTGDKSFLKNCVQLVYQDPFSSFNPKHTVGDSVLEIINLYNSNHTVEGLFKMVSLDPVLIRRYPHELSGGQKQRVSIARVLASNPKVIVFDESLSALDVETQYSLLKLIRSICTNLSISVVFITHNISSVFYLCDRVVVLQSGKLLECFNAFDLFSNKRKKYTKKIINDSLFL